MKYVIVAIACVAGYHIGKRIGEWYSYRKTSKEFSKYINESIWQMHERNVSAMQRVNDTLNSPALHGVDAIHSQYKN